jgi:DNA (cytosine-5)-methyltransferase 1
VNLIARPLNAGGNDKHDESRETYVAYGGNNTRGPIDVSAALNACKTGSGRQDFGSETFITHTLCSEGHDASEDGTCRGTPIEPVAFQPKASVTQSMNPDKLCPTIGTSKEPAVAYQCHGSNVGPMGTLRKGNGSVGGGVPFTPYVLAVRRLTPTECERLQGFPDGWTSIAADGKPMSDSARYRMLGNAVCVPVARWIGQRILTMEARNETT